MTVFKTCDSAREYLEQLASVLARLEPCVIDRVTDVLYQAYCNDRQVFVLGNGGSSATASHHVVDLVKVASVEGRRRLRAISLSDSVELLTAVANDISYEATFRFMLESLARPGDVAVAISASGSSPNVVRACEWAKENGMTLVALTGFSGGKIGGLADVHVHVPSENYGLIEDLHLAVGHIVAQSLGHRVASAG